MKAWLRMALISIMITGAAQAEETISCKAEYWELIPGSGGPGEKRANEQTVDMNLPFSGEKVEHQVETVENHEFRLLSGCIPTDFMTFTPGVSLTVAYNNKLEMSQSFGHIDQGRATIKVIKNKNADDANVHFQVWQLSCLWPEIVVPECKN